MAQLVYYVASPQQVAVQLDYDGCGFCYYESGRLAVCVNKVNDYQRRFQFYADNAAKTLLAAVDEHAVGSAGRPKGKKLLLTKDGGMLLDASDQITKSWRWDPKAQKTGSPPQEPVVIQLNDALLFTFTDRDDIVVKFAPGQGISVSFACGERLRRFDSYLDHARRETHGPQRGKLVVEQNAPTLQQRQKQIELAAIEKRSKAKPRSQDLGHDRIKAVVASLETAFDHYAGCQVTPFADGNWKETARLQSLREIPRLPPTGTEVGDAPTLLGSRVEPFDASDSLQRLKHATTGQWLGSVELHERILEENPSLARKGALSVASGRYARELAVAGYVNGRKPSRSARLRCVPASSLDRFLRESCPKDVLVVVACLRTDDAQSCTMERLLEQVQARLNELETEPQASQTAEFASKCRLVKCDLAESSLLADRFRIHAAPTFLLFYDAKLVHVSSLGGEARRVFPATTNAHLSDQVDSLPRVLLVEPVAKHQLATERVLRNESFLWDLALSGEQAVTFFSRPSLRGNAASSSISVTLASPPPVSTLTSCPYGLVMVSDTLPDPELRAIDRIVRAKDKLSGGAILCAVVSSPRTDVQFASAMCVDCRRAQGRRVSAEVATTRRDTALACPHCGILSAESKTSVVSPVLAEVAQVLVYKHVKSATLHRLTEQWIARTRPATSPKPSVDASYTGLTVDSFFREMEKHHAAAKRGAFLPTGQVPEMALSVVDAVLPVTSVATTPTRSTHTVVNLLRASSA